jgi:hypothetical protein
MSFDRVAVQLQPREDGVFVTLLKQRKMNPNLRIDNVRRTKDVEMVIEHCRRRWKEPLGQLGKPPLKLFTGEGVEIFNVKVTIEELCQKAVIVDGKLTLRYSVTDEQKSSLETEVTSLKNAADEPGVTDATEEVAVVEATATEPDKGRAPSRAGAALLDQDETEAAAKEAPRRVPVAKRRREAYQRSLAAAAADQQ